MVRLRVLTCAIGVTVCASVPALAQGRMIDVKIGLWEMASERSTSGMPKMSAVPQIPPDVLASMPPEQRARIRAAMEAARGKSGKRTRIKKICLTRTSLERGPAFDSDLGASCTRTSNVLTPRKWEMRAKCVMQGREQTIHVRYEAPTPDTINGTVDIVMTDGSQRMTMNQVVRGRWIGADCGRVRPSE